MAVIALLVGGVVATLLFWPNALTATIRPQQTPSTGAEASPTPTAETTSAATATPSATSSRSATPSATATPASGAAVAAMNACRNRVQAADEVLNKGRTGVRHWEAHVDAERRAEAGTISIVKRQKIFKETRLKGPEDQKHYADALRAYDKVKDASCGKKTGADAKVTATLARCQQRVKAQDPAMSAAAAAMGDWKRHLADMQRSRVQHNSNAQQVWINTYKAAPPNINAYEKATRAFKKAPKC